MFTNNKFGKLDPVAEAIKGIAEADYKSKMEELKGNQKVLDKNKNNKLDAQDFAILRGEKKSMKKEEVVQEGDMDEGSYSAKAARAGKDIGKPGKAFAKIAASAAKRYGSKERGEKVAGAVLKKLRMKEDIDLTEEQIESYLNEYDELLEANNPFDYKNYKSQLQSKPGEKAGFDSKKISTGTVYSRKPVKDEPVKKEEVDPKNTTTDTLKGREKTSDNKFLSKKVFMDVPGDVKEESEQIDELKKTTVKSYLKKKMDSLPGKDPKKDQESMMKAHHRVTGVKPTSEEVEQVEERTLTPGETSEKERIVKGMKKSLAGFKQRYGDKAKSVMYATATKAAKKD